MTIVYTGHDEDGDQTLIFFNETIHPGILLPDILCADGIPDECVLCSS